jgi:hypothetical protein
MAWHRFRAPTPGAEWHCPWLRYRDKRCRLTSAEQPNRRPPHTPRASASASSMLGASPAYRTAGPDGARVRRRSSGRCRATGFPSSRRRTCTRRSRFAPPGWRREDRGHSIRNWGEASAPTPPRPRPRPRRARPVQTPRIHSRQPHRISAGRCRRHRYTA